MRTRLYSPLLLLLLIPFLKVDAQSWQWARCANGNTGMSLIYGNRAISYDNFGNIYTVSRVTYNYGPTHIDTILVPTGTFFTKWDALTGEIKWMKKGFRTLETNSITVDASGNMYFAGTFDSTIHFGAYTLTPCASCINFCLVKFDSSGNVLWARQSTDSFQQRARDIAIDNTGNVYIGGVFRSTNMILGNDTLHATVGNSFGYSTFLAKYDPDGNIMWARSVVIDSPAIGTSTDWHSLATDNFGHVYIAGIYGDIVGTTTISTGNDTFPLPGTYGFFITKFTNSGQCMWLKANEHFNSSTIATDAAGNLYINGDYPVGDTLDSIPLNIIGTKDIFLAKYNSDGNILWAKSGGTQGIDWHSMGMYVKNDGTCYTTAGEDAYATCSHLKFGDSIFNTSDSALDLSARINTDSSGNILSGILTNSGGFNYMGISVDPLDNIFTAGGYVDSLVLGNDTTLYNIVPTVWGHQTYFVAKYGIDSAFSNYTHGIGLNSFTLMGYPNPFRDFFYLTCTVDNAQYRLFDLNGRVFRKGTIHKGINAINLVNISKGYYMLNVFNKEGNASLRIFKQ